MRLSDAINLGITQWRLTPDKWTCKDGGCLLGVGAMAAGVDFASRGDDDLTVILGRWPWLITEVELSSDLLRCNRGHLCSHLHGWTGFGPAYSIISCMAFCLQNGGITVEQIVDWVRSVEPQEDVMPIVESVHEAVCA